MDLDAGAVQTEAFDADCNQALPLKGFENPFEDALLGPPAKPRVDGVPIAVFFRQTPPFAAVLGNIEQRIEQAPVIDFHIAALHRQKRQQQRVLRITEFHPNLILAVPYLSVNRP